MGKWETTQTHSLDSAASRAPTAGQLCKSPTSVTLSACSVTASSPQTAANRSAMCWMTLGLPPGRSSPIFLAGH